MIIDPSEANPNIEPCLACGEETAVGSVFYSDRHPAESKDGTRGYSVLGVRETDPRQRPPRGHERGALVEGSVMGLTGGWF